MKRNLVVRLPLRLRRTKRLVCAILVCIPVGALFWVGLPEVSQAQSAVSHELSRTVTFDSSRETVEHRVKLNELGDSFAADWTPYRTLVLELRASSTQRMGLRIYRQTGEGKTEEFSRVLLHLYPKVTIRAEIPLELLSEPPKTGVDMAAVGNRSRPGYFIGLWGPFVALDKVAAIGFEMQHPVGSPTLEIRSVGLSREESNDAVIEGAPLVDEFGQFVHEEWPGKAKSLSQLEEVWRKEEKELHSGDFGYCSYGGYKETDARATGFFRVEKINGRWWFVDPDGHLFLSAGCDVIRPEISTRSRGREYFFSQMPPEARELNTPSWGDRRVSFFTWNLMRRFGEDWKSRWIDLTLRRMEAWGLNTVANWSDEDFWNKPAKPYVIDLDSWQTEVSYLGLPDVYSEEFVTLSDERARRQCEPRKNDPWLLGYFLANEPPFTQKELQTVDLILAGPATATQQALKKWLGEGDTPERRKEFIGGAFDRYVQVTSEAVKKYDPLHLNLGMRGGGRPTEAEIAAARAFDVYSVNIYNYEVTRERVEDISRLTGKPIIIGEFHFGTPGRGLAASLVQVKDQAERGVAYRYYVEQAFSMPDLIGTHWFQWMDQPCTGRFDGENYNIGLVDVTDRPYAELVNALRETHQRLYRVHSGTVDPFSQKAKPN